ncbi:hypothetical protein CR513_09649, partial [Mucuna pruriens]
MGHSMKNYWALKHKVQDLIEGGWLNFKEVGLSAEAPFRKPLTIYYDPVRTPRVPLTIDVPAQPTYRDNHAVPWQYDLTVPEMPKEKEPAKEITNIAESGGITRSGRIYTLETLRGKETYAPAARSTPTANTQVPVPEKEVEEFLKIIRHSEYQLLDQMNKTLARI